MTWNLNVRDYTDAELLELFNITHAESNSRKSQKLMDSISKVRSDSSKTQEEVASFASFVEAVAERLGFALMEQRVGLGEFDTAAKAFSTKQPTTMVNGHVIIDSKPRTDAFTRYYEGREGSEDRAPPGQLNPVKVHTVFKAVNIDSRFRDNYYTTKSTDYIVTLPERITDCTKLQLGNLTIPLTAYCFSEELGNTTFVITLTRTPGPTITRYVITIPDGNYGSPFGGGASLTQIASMINTKMAAAGINTTTELSFNIDSLSGKSVFSVPVASPVTAFTVEFATGSDGVVLADDNLQMRLGWTLGFRNGVYNTSGPTVAIESEGVCLPVCPRYIFLAIEDYQPSGVDNYFNSGYQSSLLPNSILTRIDIGSLNGEQGYFTLGDAQGTTTGVNTSRSYFGPVTLERLRLTLYDEYGRIVNLNNMDWSVSLSMTCIYDKA